MAEMTFGKLIDAIAPAAASFPKPINPYLGKVSSSDHRILTGPLVLIRSLGGGQWAPTVIPNLAVTSGSDQAGAGVSYRTLKSRRPIVAIVESVNFRDNRLILRVRDGSMLTIRPIEVADIPVLSNYLPRSGQSINSVDSLVGAYVDLMGKPNG